MNLKNIIDRYKTEICWETVDLHFKRVDAQIVLYSTLASLFILFNMKVSIHKLDKKYCTHFDKCIELYVNPSKSLLFKYKILRIIKSFSSDYIYGIYGNKSMFSLLIGRIRYLILFFKIRFQSKYISKLFKK